MNRTIIVVAVALTLLIAGCGGPGEAPEDGDDEMPDEDPEEPEEEDEPIEEEDEQESSFQTVTPSLPAVG